MAGAAQRCESGGGISFTFPTNISIPAGGVALVVPFDPGDAQSLAAFRARYNITNSTLQIFGPWSGKLGNRGDRVALERPLTPDLPGDPYSWVIVDEMIYGNQTPWPTNANGRSPSLHRTVANGCGNNSLIWFAGAPTPGQASTADRDGDGLPDAWMLQHFGHADAQAGDLSRAGDDPDGDGLTNLQEYLTGSDPHDAGSPLRFTSVAMSGSGPRLRFPVLAGRMTPDWQAT